ncbi:MAG: hypothetical protein AMJ53_03335 [Gammaproteobacteria bacterium SG8_11]|nr:MAG: hypothetical protein AMJ53_03335 [Gammaproteobacteria bacterium SG8_11]
MKRLLLSTFLSLTLSIPAYAGDNDINMKRFPSEQELFGDLIRDLGTAMSYRAVAPAEPLDSPLGIDVGLVVTSSKMKNELDGWKTATSANGQDTIYNSEIHVRKVLPLGFDVGAYFGSVSDSNMKSMGGEIRYAILNDSNLTPALAVRGSYKAMSGVDDLDLSTAGLELSISKVVFMAKPYAGLGAIHYEGEGTGIDNYKFESERDTLAKYFLGVNFDMGPVNFAAEADKTGENSSYKAKFGVRW